MSKREFVITEHVTSQVVHDWLEGKHCWLAIYASYKLHVNKKTLDFNFYFVNFLILMDRSYPASLERGVDRLYEQTCVEIGFTRI